MDVSTSFSPSYSYKMCSLQFAGPGHFLEVRKILPLLTATSPDHPSFHVVAPSLPGFGFSSGVNKMGFKGPQYAEVAVVQCWRYRVCLC